MSPVMTLSERFDKIDASRVVVKPVFNAGAAQRRDDVESRRKIGRQTQLDARRQGVTNVKPVMRAAQTRAIAPRQQPSQQQQQRQTFNYQGRGQGRGFRVGRGGPRPTGMPPRNNSNSNNNGGGGSSSSSSSSIQRNLGKALPSRGSGGRGAIRGASGRGGGPGGRGGRGRGRNAGRGNSAFVKLSKDVDLDEGLDEYWFKAGKGPDPKVASLDRSLDNYWNSRNGAKSEGTDQKTSTGGIVSDAAEPSEGADGVDPDL